jgi:hypothetical protein
MLGQRPWEVIPGLEESPLIRTVRDVRATRDTRIVTVPSAVKVGHDVWARVSPTPEGGVRVALRYLDPQPSGLPLESITAMLPLAFLPWLMFCAAA